MKRLLNLRAPALGIILGWSLATFAPPGFAATTVLTVGDELKQQMKYGLDYERLWFWYGPAVSDSAEVAKWSVVDCNIDYIRCAINAAYELTEGTYDLSAYTNKIIPMMTAMQNAKPSIKWFASPRPLNEAVSGAAWQPYPRWVTGDNGSGSFNFQWEKCAQYLIRYLLLMDSYGFKISYLDITNEWQSYPTGARLQPSDVVDIRNYLIANLPKSIETPKIVAPSAWSFQQGASFINHAVGLGAADGFDIAASHNTGHVGTPQDFADAANAAGKEIWDTEVHGWKGASPATEVPTSFEMFDRIQAGFSGLSGWLAIGTTSQGHCYLLNNGSTVTRNVKYYIFQQLANTSNYGYALDIDQPTGLTSTAALIREGLLTVWVLNNYSTPVPTRIEIGNRTMRDSSIKRIRWSESIPVEGAKDVIAATTSSSFEATIQGNSLYCFEIYLESDGDHFPFIQAEKFSEMTGVAVLPATDLGEGDLVEFSDANDEISFDLTVTQTASFDVAFRVSSESARIRFDVFNGERLVASVDRLATGDAQNWTTLYAKFALEGGPERLTIKATGGGWNMNWIEFKERLTYVQENLALKNIATASGVSGRSYTANRAVDGSRDTRWESDSTQPAWLAVDFGSPTAINGFSLSEYEDRITAYEIQFYADDETWKTALIGGNPDDDIIYAFPTVTASKIRLQTTSVSSDPVSIYELTFHFNPYYAFTDPVPTVDTARNAVILNWSGVRGSTYRLERATNLDPDAFETIESGIPVHQSTNSNTVAAPGEANFYRLMLERE